LTGATRKFIGFEYLAILKTERRLNVVKSRLFIRHFTDIIV